MNPYSLVTDSNTLLAVITGVSSFLYFKNIKIKYSKVINLIGGSTFGVLQIHTSSDTMRLWLWNDIVNVQGAYYLSFNNIVFHAVSWVLIILCICTVIDLLRINTIEKWIFNFLDKIDVWKYEKLLFGKD